jgi:DnaJ family protein A protein 2
MFFGGGGGFPFGDFGDHFGGSAGRGPKADVDTEKYYNILGVKKDATSDEIKKAFRKLALKMHPDRGGDTEKFQELNKAHEVLSDPEKRKLYDRFGEEGLQGGGGGGPDLSDLLGGMFGGGGRRAQQGPRKGKSVLHPVKATLADLYNGKSTKVVVNRDRICSKCNGKGGKSGAVSACSGCKGRGMRTYMQQLGPGMYS